MGTGSQNVICIPFGHSMSQREQRAWGVPGTGSEETRVIVGSEEIVEIVQLERMP